MKIFNFQLFVCIYFAASVVSAKTTKEWTDLFNSFIGMLQDANENYTNANVVEMAELRAIWSEFEYKYLEEFKIQLPKVASGNQYSSQGAVVDMKKFKEYYGYAKPFDGRTDMMRFHEPISREEIFKELDKLANEMVRNEANGKLKVIEDRLNAEIAKLKKMDKKDEEVKENLKKLENERKGFHEFSIAFRSNLDKIEKFVLDSKSLLITGRLSGKLENLRTALINDAKEIYKLIESEVIKHFIFFNIVLGNDEKVKKIIETKKDKLNEFFHEFDPNKFMESLPPTKQKYVDSLILTEENFYKEGIMDWEVIQALRYYDVFVFRELDTGDMKIHANFDTDIKNIYKKYITVNDLRKNIYTEIAQQITWEAPNPKLAPSYNPINLIKKIITEIPKTVTKSLKENEHLTKSLQMYEKFQLNTFFVKLVNKMLSFMKYSIEKIGPKYANLMEKEALSKLEKYYREGRNFVQSLDPESPQHLKHKNFMRMDRKCKKFGSLMRLIQVWILRNELVEGYLKRLGLSVVRNANEPGKVKIERKLSNRANEDPALSQSQLDQIAEVLTIYESFAYFYNLKELVDWVKKLSKEQGNDRIMRTIRLELNLDIPSAAAFPSYAEDGIGAMVYELYIAIGDNRRSHMTWAMDLSVMPKKHQRPARSNERLSPPWIVRN